jgi:exodeoxyribonuclease V alpha subunit
VALRSYGRNSLGVSGFQNSRHASEHPDNVALQQVSAADLAAGEDGEETPVDRHERVTLTRGVIRLQHRRRFDSPIARLADAVRNGEANATLTALADGDDVTLVDPGDISAMRDAVVAAETELVTAALAGDVAAALSALTSHRLPCAHREGPFGRAHWAAQARDWTASAVGRNLGLGGLYAGQPSP